MLHQLFVAALAYTIATAKPVHPSYGTALTDGHVHPTGSGGSKVWHHPSWVTASPDPDCTEMPDHHKWGPPHGKHDKRDIVEKRTIPLSALTKIWTPKAHSNIEIPETGPKINTTDHTYHREGKDCGDGWGCDIEKKECCSKFGYCGTGLQYCGWGCQNGECEPFGWK